MSGRTDLTRWNRAGLSRFRYIDGHAAEWLEALRQALLAEGGDGFSQWRAVQDTALSDETDVERLERLKKQYEAGRQDMLWETTRTFARACHILTEYTDVYANEGFLRTATQWENLRRMVEMLDYHPAPPSSASTMLVLQAKGEQGKVDQGFQVKYVPPDGGAPVIFETLEDIEVATTLNELRLEDGNKAKGNLVANSGSSPLIVDVMPKWTEVDGMDALSMGQVFVVEDSANSDAYADRIQSFVEDNGTVQLLGKSNDWTGVGKFGARLLLHPKSIRTPRLNGSNVVQFDVSHGLSGGDVIAWKSGDVWNYAEVLESDEFRIRYAGDTPPTGDVYRALVIKKPDTGSIVFPLDGGYKSISVVNTGVAVAPLHEDVKDAGGNTYAYRVKDVDATLSQLYLIHINENKIGSVSTITGSDYTFDGSPAGLSSGDWVACEIDNNGTCKALKVKTVEEQEGRFILELSDGTGEIRRLYGPFKYELHVQGYDRNETTLNEDGKLASFPLDLGGSDSLPELLVPGRRLLIEQENGDAFENAVMAKVTSVAGGTITFDPPLKPDAGFTYANTVIRANVVEAGHGERQPERVLGSGIADQSNQEFVFGNENVSFVADSTMDAGVRADIDVKVDGRIWTQVSTLNDSHPADAHYAVRMTEQGYIRICFGDGVYGRRLPSGINNLRIDWRKGTGLAGYVEPGGLETPVKPHRLIDSVRQPMATNGAGDMEDAASLRVNAPSSLLTLERAVSIADFRNLAASYSSIAQANAFAATSLSARHDSVEVVVVPADGSALGDDLKGTLESWLADHSLPAVEVKVSGFESVTLGLEIMVRVKTAEFDPQAVVADVRSALLAGMSLQTRGLGQSLYRSELYEVVEAVTGVENSTCTITGITPDQAALVIHGQDQVTIKAVKASGRQVVYLAADGLALEVKYEEFTL